MPLAAWPAVRDVTGSSWNTHQVGNRRSQTCDAKEAKPPERRCCSRHYPQLALAQAPFHGFSPGTGDDAGTRSGSAVSCHERFAEPQAVASSCLLPAQESTSESLRKAAAQSLGPSLHVLEFAGRCLRTSEWLQLRVLSAAKHCDLPGQALRLLESPGLGCDESKVREAGSGSHVATQQSFAWPGLGCGA